jgi:REP element-mobilizing transposase RayT
MAEHVHLLVSLPPVDLAQYIGRVKGASSHHFNKEFGPAHTFCWQDGYGVVSLRTSDTETVIRYIENQEAIHAARLEAGPSMNLLMEQGP